MFADAAAAMWAMACLFSSLFPFVIIMTACSFGLDEKRRVWESYGATICTCGDFQTPAPCTKSDNSLVCRKKRNVTYYMFYRHRYKIMCLSTLKNYMSSLFRQWNNVFYVEGILENHIQFYLNAPLRGGWIWTILISIQWIQHRIFMGADKSVRLFGKNQRIVRHATADPVVIRRSTWPHPYSLISNSR